MKQCFSPLGPSRKTEPTLDISNRKNLLGGITNKRDGRTEEVKGREMRLSRDNWFGKPYHAWDWKAEGQMGFP